MLRAMGRGALLAALATLALPAATSAHKPGLSVARAKAAMLANAQLDQPASVTVTGCQRLSRVRVACTVSEHQAHTLVEVGGELVTADLAWDTEATLAHGRVTVRLLLEQ